MNDPNGSGNQANYLEGELEQRFKDWAGQMGFPGTTISEMLAGSSNCPQYILYTNGSELCITGSIGGCTGIIRECISDAPRDNLTPEQQQAADILCGKIIIGDDSGGTP